MNRANSAVRIATGIDFICGQPLCGGAFNVTFGSGTATSANASGVTVVNDSGPIGDVTKQFTMAFDTTAASPNFTLTEIGGAETTLNGTITAILSGSQMSNGLDILTLSVSFANLPADFAAILGAPSGLAANTDIFIQGGTGLDNYHKQVHTRTSYALAVRLRVARPRGLVRRKLNV